MSDSEFEAKQAAKADLCNARDEVEKLTTIRNKGEIESGGYEKHRDEENAARDHLDAMKVRWYEVDPENAPHPDTNPYIYPQP